MKRLCSIVLLLSVPLQAAEYSHLYEIDASASSSRLQRTSNELVWTHKETQPFTDSIISWNIIRPKKGLYTMWVNTCVGRWSGWQKLATWGAHEQKSHLATKHECVHTKHVRTQVQGASRATGFQVKVMAHGGASLAQVKKLFCSTCNEYTFSFVSFDPSLKSALIKDVPAYSQMLANHERFLDLCCPTATCITTDFLNGIKRGQAAYDVAVPAAARAAHDSSYLDIYGNWQFNVARAFNQVATTHHVCVQRCNSFDEIRAQLAANIPVPVSIRGRLDQGFKSYDNGHFVVVIGYDRTKKKVLCIDPAFRHPLRMIRRFDFDQFARAWGKSRNLAYMFTPK